MDDHDPLALPVRPPTSARPLLGLTVLVVEDSRFASEALRLLCLRSGARIRRADCLKSAHRHLQVYHPSVAIIDIGLRDGSGAELIEELAQTPQRTNVILGMSGDPDGRLMAMTAGADGFLDKPVLSLSKFQETILSHLPQDRQPSGPRPVSNEKVDPDPIAYHDDLAHMADIIDGARDDSTLDYVAQFLAGVARSAKDDAILNAVTLLEKQRATGKPAGSAMAQLAGLVQERLEQKIAM